MKNVQYEIFDLPEIAIIGTSAIIETELDGIVGMNSGIFNNPFISWGRYPQMDGSHAGNFLEKLQHIIKEMK